MTFAQNHLFSKATFIVGLAVFSVISTTAQAQPRSTASQDRPFSQRNYCASNLKADIPKGSMDTQLVGNVSCMVQRLDAFTTPTQPVAVRYQAYQAKAWLTYALHEASERSLTADEQFALRQAATIFDQLNDQTSPQINFDFNAPFLDRLRRPDLWAKVQVLKSMPSSSTLMKQIADSEVKLYWAQNEYCERGWRHAREHFSAAERWINAVELTALPQDEAEQSAYQTNYETYYRTLAQRSESQCQRPTLTFKKFNFFKSN